MKKTNPKNFFKNLAQHQVEFSFLSSLFRSKTLLIITTIYLLLFIGFVNLLFK